MSSEPMHLAPRAELTGDEPQTQPTAVQGEPRPWFEHPWLEVLRRESSTRGAALLRIATAWIMWVRWGAELLPLRGIVHPAVSVAFFVATTCLFLGVGSRLAALASGIVGMILVHGYGIAGGYEPWTHHHTTLLAHMPLLLALTACGRSYSVDRWLALRRALRSGAPPPEERGPSYGLKLIALQMSVVYFFSSYDKLDFAFLSGQRLEAIFGWYYWGSDAPDWPWLRWAFPCAGTATVVLELSLAFGLWLPRARPWLIPLGLVLHGTFYVLLPVDTFTATVWCLYVAYLDQDRLHALLDELQGHSNQREVPFIPKPYRHPHEARFR